MINPINKKDNKCFQYALALAIHYNAIPYLPLYHEEIGKHPERIKKIKPFINKYNWEGKNYRSEKDD